MVLSDYAGIVSDVGILSVFCRRLCRMSDCPAILHTVRPLSCLLTLYTAVMSAMSFEILFPPSGFALASSKPQPQGAAKGASRGVRVRGDARGGVLDLCVALAWAHAWAQVQQPRADMNPESQPT